MADCMVLIIGNIYIDYFYTYPLTFHLHTAINENPFPNRFRRAVTCESSIGIRRRRRLSREEFIAFKRSRAAAAAAGNRAYRRYGDIGSV